MPHAEAPTGLTPVLVATRSAGKLRELVPLLRAYGLQLVSPDDLGLADDPAEDGLEVFETFEENALAKARWFYARSGGLPTLADDSGLVVDALGGAPGVRSKRWGGFTGLAGEALDRANCAHLLQMLGAAESAGHVGRDAAYVCAAACVWDGGELVTSGETRGRILHEAQGVGGFGYDPYFHSAELGVSFGLASTAAKSGVSHRGRAFRALLGRMPFAQVAESKLSGPVDPAQVAG